MVASWWSIVGGLTLRVSLFKTPPPDRKASNQLKLAGYAKKKPGRLASRMLWRWSKKSAHGSVAWWWSWHLRWGLGSIIGSWRRFAQWSTCSHQSSQLRQPTCCSSAWSPWWRRPRTATGTPPSSWSCWVQKAAAYSREQKKCRMSREYLLNMKRSRTTTRSARERRKERSRKREGKGKESDKKDNTGAESLKGFQRWTAFGLSGGRHGRRSAALKRTRWQSWRFCGGSFTCFPAGLVCCVLQCQMERLSGQMPLQNIEETTCSQSAPKEWPPSSFTWEVTSPMRSLAWWTPWTTWLYMLVVVLSRVRCQRGSWLSGRSLQFSIWLTFRPGGAPSGVRSPMPKLWGGLSGSRGCSFWLFWRTGDAARGVGGRESDSSLATHWRGGNPKRHWSGATTVKETTWIRCLAWNNFTGDPIWVGEDRGCRSRPGAHGPSQGWGCVQGLFGEPGAEWHRGREKVEKGRRWDQGASAVHFKPHPHQYVSRKDWWRWSPAAFLPESADLAGARGLRDHPDGFWGFH